MAIKSKTKWAFKMEGDNPVGTNSTGNEIPEGFLECTFAQKEQYGEAGPDFPGTGSGAGLGTRQFTYIDGELTKLPDPRPAATWRAGAGCTTDDDGNVHFDADQGGDRGTVYLDVIGDIETPDVLFDQLGVINVVIVDGTATLPIGTRDGRQRNVRHSEVLNISNRLIIAVGATEL